MNKHVTLISNGFLFFIAGLLRMTYDSGSLKITALSVVIAALGAFVGMFILVALNTFVKPKKISLKYQKHKGKLNAVKTTQMALVLAGLLSITLLQSTILLLSASVLLFAVPGVVAIKYNVLYSGIIVFGGSYITGEKAKSKGVALLAFAGILLLATIGLSVV